MFRCTTSPPEESFPSTLAGLNMALNDDGKPVDITTGAPFAFFISDNARTNDLRKEAFHTAMRAEMRVELAKYGISKHFITANNTLLSQKPVKKHVPVLMNEVRTVQKARDVIIVVGESHQDCGVIAWRLIREKHGLRRGTVVGLAAAVKEEYGQSLNAPGAKEESNVPAIIVLNPGQLFYSYRDEKAKTLVSWNDSPRANKMQEYPDVIDRENMLKGHTNAREHVHTFIEQILPGMIDRDTRLYFVAIGDGAEHVLTALDKRMTDKSVPPFLSRQVEAVAMVCPSISTPKADFCDNLLFHIANYGKSWDLSDRPLGTCIAAPKLATTVKSIFGRKDSPTLGCQQSAFSDDSDEDSNDDDYMYDHGSGDDEEGGVKVKEEQEDPFALTFSSGKINDGIIETAFEMCMGPVLAFLSMRRDIALELEKNKCKLAELELARDQSESVVLCNGTNGDSHD